MIEKRGIEVGHIFKLGTKYSESMNCRFQDADGEEQPMIMGCYGLGVSRTVAAAVEQNHDDKGIIWPLPLAPYEVVLVVLNCRQGSGRRGRVGDLRQLFEPPASTFSSTIVPNARESSSTTWI